jgi:urease subunit alpha
MREAVGGGERNDNERILRYVAKLTVNPAIAHGIAHDVGTLEPGKLADVVLWRPAFFGAKPQAVIKAGFSAWGPLGSGSGSTRLGEPLVYNPQYGGVGGAPAALSTVYTSSVGQERVRERWPGRVALVRDCRRLRKSDMVRNDARPSVVVDPVAQQVTVDGTAVELEPASSLPLNRAYFLV